MVTPRPWYGRYEEQLRVDVKRGQWKRASNVRAVRKLSNLPEGYALPFNVVTVRQRPPPPPLDLCVLERSQYDVVVGWRPPPEVEGAPIELYELQLSTPGASGGKTGAGGAGGGPGDGGGDGLASRSVRKTGRSASTHTRRISPGSTSRT